METHAPSVHRPIIPRPRHVDASLSAERSSGEVRGRRPLPPQKALLLLRGTPSTARRNGACRLRPPGWRSWVNARASRTNPPPVLGALGFGPAYGHFHGEDGFRHYGRRFGRGALGAIVHAGCKAVESYLGITQAQLRGALASGKSIAQIAKAHGTTTDGLVAAIVAAAKARLDRAVAAKHLTSAQEQALLGRLEGLVRSLVTRSPRQRLRHGFGFAPGLRHRFWGPAGRMRRSPWPLAGASAPQLWVLGHPQR